MFRGRKKPAGSSAIQISKAINRKAVVVGVLLIVSVLIMVVMLSIESSHARKNKIYTTIASAQKDISPPIAINALAASAGQSRAFDRLAANQNRYLGNLEIYNTGDTARDLPSLPEKFGIEYSNLKASWGDYDKNIVTVVAAKKSIATVSEYVTQINESIPELATLSDEIILELVKSNAASSSIAVAARQLNLILSI